MENPVKLRPHHIWNFWRTYRCIHDEGLSNKVKRNLKYYNYDHFVEEEKLMEVCSQSLLRRFIYEFFGLPKFIDHDKEFNESFQETVDEYGFKYIKNRIRLYRRMLDNPDNANILIVASVDDICFNEAERIKCPRLRESCHIEEFNVAELLGLEIGRPYTFKELALILLSKERNDGVNLLPDYHDAFKSDGERYQAEHNIHIKELEKASDIYVSDKDIGLNITQYQRVRKSVRYICLLDNKKT